MLSYILQALSTANMSSPQIKLPGFGLDVNYEGPEDRFPNVIMDWEGTPLTVRERTMMSLMDQITDKPEWDRKVFDEGIVQRWRQEAKEADMDVSEKMLEWVSKTHLIGFCFLDCDCDLSSKHTLLACSRCCFIKTEERN